MESMVIGTADGLSRFRSLLERYRKGVVNPVTIANGFVYLSGMLPFEPKSGEIAPQAPFEQQCERVLAQLRAS